MTHDALHIPEPIKRQRERTSSTGQQPTHPAWAMQRNAMQCTLHCDLAAGVVILLFGAVEHFPIFINLFTQQHSFPLVFLIYKHKMSAGDNDLTASFRTKAIYMKSWKPASAPSNRDRLELYALHKQAVSGDAPATFSASASAADRAKYQAWKGKLGLNQAETMRLYLSEADRQIRVYGNLTPQTPQATPNTTNGNGNGNGSSAVSGNSNNSMDTPRGLAAIPLLCAAAAESRQAYIRRLSQTPYENAWWKRQEALCGTPGTVTALPEMVVLQLARFVEHLSLSSNNNTALQAFLWPLHNSFLSVWMLIILVLTLLERAWHILQIVVWGARRTGLSLTKVWEHDLGLWQQCIHAMCEAHQATTCRLVGLVLLPQSYALGILKQRSMIGSSMTLASTIFVVLVIGGGWWYFVLLLPWLTACLLAVATMSGSCFALIQIAGV